MPTYQIAPPTSDGTSGYDTATTMVAQFDNRAYPPIGSYMKILFDLSAYSGTVTAARIRLNGQSFTATRGVSKQFVVQHVGGVTTVLGTFIYTAAGMVWYTLSNVNVITTGTTNLIHVVCQDPGVGNQRTFTAYTKEQAASPDNYDPMLEITIGTETVSLMMV